MFGAMYRGITGFFKDVKQISDEKRPPSINTNVNNSRNNKLPPGVLMACCTQQIG